LQHTVTDEERGVNTRPHISLQLWTKEAVKSDYYGQQYQTSIYRRRPWMGREGGGGGPASN